MLSCALQVENGRAKAPNPDPEEDEDGWVRNYTVADESYIVVHVYVVYIPISDRQNPDK